MYQMFAILPGVWLLFAAGRHMEVCQAGQSQSPAHPQDSIRGKYSISWRNQLPGGPPLAYGEPGVPACCELLDPVLQGPPPQAPGKLGPFNAGPSG